MSDQTQTPSHPQSQSGRNREPAHMNADSVILADARSVTENAQAFGQRLTEDLRKETAPMVEELKQLRSELANKRGRGKTVFELVSSQFAGDFGRGTEMLEALEQQSRSAEEEIAKTAGIVVPPYRKMTFKEIGLLVLTTFGTGLAAGAGGVVFYNRRQARLAMASTSASSEPSTEA
jgi:hypothetical protein